MTLLIIAALRITLTELILKQCETYACGIMIQILCSIKPFPIRFFMAENSSGKAGIKLRFQNDFVYIHAIGSANPLSFHTVLKPREMI
jgi:hypothetical protein